MRRILLLVLLLALLGCVPTAGVAAARRGPALDWPAPAEEGPPEPPAPEPERERVPPHVDSAALAAYRIGPGDSISVRVLRHPEFQADVRVTPYGTLVLPILGEVEVVGLSAEELDRRLTGLIGRDYLVDPEVYVTITDFENMKVLVTGHVATPGFHKLHGPTTILDLLGRVGQLQAPHADTIIVERVATREEVQDGRRVKVRDTESLSVDLRKLLEEGDLSQNLVLKNNDKIYVPPDSARLYVFGEVSAPGFYPYRQGVTIYDAIRLAGGFTQFANEKKIQIRRKAAQGSDEPEEIRVNLKEMLKKGDISHNIPLQEGDVIIVGSSFLF